MNFRAGEVERCSFLRINLFEILIMDGVKSGFVLSQPAAELLRKILHELGSSGCIETLLLHEEEVYA
jgi:hypothetical protein